MTTLLEANINSIVTTKEAKSKGLTKQQLRELVSDNKLERVGHGLYAPTDAWVDELYILHKRYPLLHFLKISSELFTSIPSSTAISQSLTSKITFIIFLAQMIKLEGFSRTRIVGFTGIANSVEHLN